MLSGYAARDHRQIVIKQRRPDQGSRNKPSDGSYRVDSHGIRHSSDSRQLASMHFVKRSAIAERCSCHLFSFRKEVIQPQVLLRLPCYDFTPIMNYTLGGCPLAVGSPTSSATHFRDVTGGVYKARERIHRGVLIRDY